MSVEFQFKHITFIVKRSLLNPENIVYRDIQHLGGPWSNAYLSINNKSLDPLFRRHLRNAVTEVALDK